MNKLLLSVIITAVVVGGGAFYGGMKYQASKTPQRPQMLGANVGNFRNRAGANLVNGEIIGKDDKSITVKSNDGSSKIIFFSNTTRIMKSAESSSGDLVAGEQISVNGTANQDGSITAQSIQINKPIPSR